MVEGNYEIRVAGRLSDAMVAEFEGLSVTTEPVETVLFGALPDQDALHALLIKLQSAGLEVVELHKLPDVAEPPAPSPEEGHRRQA